MRWTPYNSRPLIDAANAYLDGSHYECLLDVACAPDDDPWQDAPTEPGWYWCADKTTGKVEPVPCGVPAEHLLFWQERTRKYKTADLWLRIPDPQPRGDQ